jgi:hypothetical protein
MCLLWRRMVTRRRMRRSFKVVYPVTLVFGDCAIIAALYCPNLDHKLTDEVTRRLTTPTPSSRKVISRSVMLAVV